jgi:hypothetical protein
MQFRLSGNGHGHGKGKVDITELLPDLAVVMPNQ